MFGLSGQELRFAVVISLTHLFQHFLIRLVPPLIPVLAVVFEYPLWQLGLLISLYSLGSGISQAPMGVLSDKIDRLYLLAPFIVLAGLGYVLFALAPIVGEVVPALALFGHTFDGTLIVMCVAMIVVGVGTAVVHPVGYPMITVNVSETNKGKVLGAFSSSAMLGDAAAPAIVGISLLVVLWDQILLLFGAVGVVFGIILYVLLQFDDYETRPRHSESEDEDAELSETIWEADNRTYMYPMVVIYVFFVTKMFSSNGVMTFLPAFIVAVYGYSFDVLGWHLGAESVANFYLSGLMISAAIAQLAIGGITDRHDPRRVLLGCVTVAAIALVAVAYLDLTAGAFLLLMVVLGGSLWGLHPARDALISEITPPEREGRTFGYIWTAAMLTGSIMPALVGWIMDTMGMREGFLVLALGAVLSGATIGLLYSKRVYISEYDTSVSV